MTIPTMRTAALVVVAALALVGCSFKDAPADKEGTATTTAEVTTTVAAGADAAFFAFVEETNQRLDDAAGDPCAILAVYQDGAGPDFPDDPTPEQTEAVIRLMARVFSDLAATDKPSNEANAQVLVDVADELIARGEALGWDFDKVSSDMDASDVSSEDIAAAIVSYSVSCGNLGQFDPTD